MDSLNDVEIAAVEAFYNNEGMRESVKKVMLDFLYNAGVLKPGKNADPLHNRAIVIVQEDPHASDELIGQKMRAFAEAVSMLEYSFGQMATIKTKVESKEPKPNKAR
jgi:hypothetical protein